MTLPWKVRAMLRTQTLLSKVGALPDAHKMLAKPHAVRMALSALGRGAEAIHLAGKLA